MVDKEAVLDTPPPFSCDEVVSCNEVCESQDQHLLRGVCCWMISVDHALCCVCVCNLVQYGSLQGIVFLNIELELSCVFSDIIEKTVTLLLAQCSHVSVDSWPSPNMEGLQILPSAPLLLLGDRPRGANMTSTIIVTLDVECLCIIVANVCLSSCS